MRLDLASFDIQVRPGDRLVFYFEHDDVLSVAGASEYAGGAAWFWCNGFRDCIDPSGPPGSLPVEPDPRIFRVEDGLGVRSVAFRTTVVPEPSLALLLPLALGCLGQGRRRA